MYRDRRNKKFIHTKNSQEKNKMEKKVTTIGGGIFFLRPSGSSESSFAVFNKEMAMQDSLKATWSNEALMAGGIRTSILFFRISSHLANVYLNTGNIVVDAHCFCTNGHEQINDPKPLNHIQNLRFRLCFISFLKPSPMSQICAARQKTLVLRGSRNHRQNWSAISRP